MKKVAISVGDLNGIGIQLALQNHNTICQSIEPLYCIDRSMLEQAALKLKLSIPANFNTVKRVAPSFKIQPAQISKHSGSYSYASFKKALKLAKDNYVDAVCTLPIHKKAWQEANIPYRGHTDALRDFFKTDAIMMLGSKKMYVALFSEHIPLKDVVCKINQKDLTQFLIDFYRTAKPKSTVAVLGLNPHAGDDGVLGDEESIIQQSINKAETTIRKTLSNLYTLPPILFSPPLVPDIAFTPNMREKYTYYIAMYHDQGLAPLKALYFDEAINISLNLPILRTSVGHGTAFDIAYKGAKLNHLSYLSAIGYITKAD